MRDAGEVEREARCPLPARFAHRAQQVGRLRHVGAEAGGTGHGAVGASKAALGDLVPAVALDLAHQPLMQAVGVDPQLPGHLRPRLHADSSGRVHLHRAGRIEREAVEQLLAGVAAGPRHVAVIELHEGDVEPGADLRAGAHGGAEAGARGFGAVDRHDEGLAATIGVVLVDVGTAGEHVIVDGEGGQVARTHAEVGHARRVVRHIVVAQLVAVAMRPCDGHRARVGEGLPRHRRGGVVERSARAAVGVPADAIPTRSLFVGHPGGQVGDRADLVVDDGRIGQPGPDDPASVFTQQGDETVQALTGQPRPRS